MAFTFFQVNIDHWLWATVKQAKPYLTKAVVAAVVLGIFQIFTSLFVMAVYNKVIPNSAMTSLISLAVGVAVIALFDYMMKLVKARLVDTASSRLEEELQPRLFAKVMTWDLHKRPQLSGSSATLVKDLESVTEMFANNTVTVLVGIPFVVINLTVIWLVAGVLAFVSTAICVATVMLSVYYYTKVSNLAEEAKKLAIDKTSVFLEATSNLEALKSISSYDQFQQKWNKVDQQSREVGSVVRINLADVSSANSFIQALGQVVLVSLGAYLVIDGQITSGGLIAAVMLNGRALQPLGQLAGVLQRWSTAKTAYERLDNVFSSVSTEEARRENIRLAEVKGPIIVRDLSYRPEGMQADILSVQRLGIPHGDRIGVVGAVGSGKSTFLKLLAGVLTPTSGTITYGTYDTSAIHQADLRRSIAYLGQSPGVFSGSVRENITLGFDGEDDEQRILEVVELTGLDLVLKRLPNGLSFKLSEGGRELSGGQKQVLALARAMYSNPTTLLFDEPTSAMDPKHERLFINRMKTFVNDKTLVVVTHRKPILELTNRVIVVDTGKIAIDGDRDEVLARFK